MNEPLDCDGYRKLLAAVERDEKESSGFHDYRAKLAWIVARTKHYAEKTGLTAEAILDAWEKDRTYWYMNYYQESQQPEIKGNARVFETVEDLRKSIGNAGFRCPACGGVSKSPYTCDTGKNMSPGKVCDWKSWGLLGTMGKGASVYVKSELRGSNIFMPVAWE